MDEAVANLQPALGGELRHPCRGSGATGRAVNGLVAIEDRVAGIRVRVHRLSRPQDMGQAADRRMQRMDEVVFRVERGPQSGGQGDQLSGRVVRHVPEILLRFHDGIEVAAIGDIHHDLAQTLHLGGQAFGVKKARHIGQAHFFDKAALLAIGDVDPAGGRVDRKLARLSRGDQPVFDGHRDCANGAVAAHRQAPGGFDEQDRHVTVGPGRRVQDRP